MYPDRTYDDDNSGIEHGYNPEPHRLHKINNGHIIIRATGKSLRMPIRYPSGFT